MFKTCKQKKAMTGMKYDPQKIVILWEGVTAGIMQKSFDTLFPLWPLKKTVVGYIDLEQKERYKKLKIEVDIVSDTGILIMLLLVMITKMILLCWYCYCYC